MSTEVEALLDVASGSLEPGSPARDALVELYDALDRERLIRLLRSRGFFEAVDVVEWMYGMADEYEASLGGGYMSPVVSSTSTEHRPRPRERRAGPTRRSRGSPGRSSSDDEPDLARPGGCLGVGAAV